MLEDKISYTRSIMQDEVIKKLRISYFFIILGLFFTICFLIGLSSNYIVIKENGCRMPVLESKLGMHLSTQRHFTFTDTSKINYPKLTDNIKINNSIYSVGDLIMWTSLILIGISFIFSLIFITKALRLNKFLNKSSKRKL